MVILLSRLGPFITKVYQGQHRQHLPTKWDDPPSNMTGYSPAAKPKKGSVAHHSSFRGKYWALATIQEITDDLLRIDLSQRKTETTCRHFELATAPFLRAQTKASYDRTTHQMNRDNLLESP